MHVDNFILAMSVSRGSSNIVRMRQVITDVVKTSVGMMSMYDLQGAAFEGKVISWHIWHNGSVQATAFKGHLDVFATNYKDPSIFPTLPNVQDVFQSLDTFMQGVLTMDPDMKRKLEPLIRAAQYKF